MRWSLLQEKISMFEKNFHGRKMHKLWTLLTGTTLETSSLFERKLWLQIALFVLSNMNQHLYYYIICAHLFHIHTRDTSILSTIDSAVKVFFILIFGHMRRTAF